MTTRCACCPWSFRGSVRDGVREAQKHRRTAHAGELPEHPSKRRYGTTRQRRFERLRQRNRDAVLAALRDAERPLRAKEVVEATQLNVTRMRAILRECPDAVEVSRGRWWLDGRELPPEPEPPPSRDAKTARGKPKANPEIEQRRKKVLGAVARLREGGVLQATAADVGEEADVSRVSAGKLLRAEGFDCLGRRGRGGHTIWDLGGS